MKRSAATVFALLLGACAAPTGSTEATEATEESALDGFDGDRNRTCAGGCAAGQVCDVAAKACVALRDGRAARVPVTFGLAGGDAVEVTSGLAPGDTVLAPVAGAGPIDAGRRVRRAP